MAKAGWCSECRANVWLAADGGCVNGHPADRISNVYEADPATDPFAQAGAAIEDAAREAGDAMHSAWKQAEPDAKEAAAAAAEAARKAAEAASAFGKKLFSGQAEEAASDDVPAAEPTGSPQTPDPPESQGSE